MSLLKDLIKASGNDYAGVVEGGVEAGDITGFIDTGSYALNALVSGSIYGGYPIGKVSGLAGDPSAGKTFAALTAVKLFLESNPNSFCMYFESESAISKDMIADRGIDTNRIVIIPVVTIQEFRTQSIKILDKYIESDKKRENRPPMLFVLDSLGMLSTTKEITDTAEGSETKDMTRNQIIKAAFRVLTLKLGRANVTLLLTTHTYACLTEGHNIRTIDGIKDIKDIVVGDEVLTLEGYQQVSSTCSYDGVKTIEIELEDGNVIRCSPEHKFIYAPTGEWVAAGNLAAGMDIQTI